MGSIKEQIELTDTQVQGLDRMRELNEEFLAKNKCSAEVREFLEKAGLDNDLLLLYLRARKNRPEHAWQTLKQKAEVRFDRYPEVFVKLPAEFYENLQEIGLWGILKHRGKHNRRILCIQGCKWDTSTLKIVDITNNFLQLSEIMLLDDDALVNGIVAVVDVAGMGLSYARHFGLNVMLRIMNTLWFACPLKIKAIYFLNVPFYFTFLYELIKPFFPKKLKERFFLTTPSKKFTELHANEDKKILPDYLGGDLEPSEAFEFIKF